MTFKYFSHNGQLKDTGEAVISLEDIEYQYGYGVYESLRVIDGYPYFMEEHAARLLHSANFISIGHDFNQKKIEEYIRQLLKKNEVKDCNIKILLIGSGTLDDAKLDILCLNPLFVDKKLYKEGAKCISLNYERAYPQAKTLNMLGSFLAYKKAKAKGAYDALLIDKDGFIREGTRTNFFGMVADTIYSPPKENILEGVMRHNVVSFAENNGYKYTEKQISLLDIADLDCCFLTSSSSKILPIKSIDKKSLEVSSTYLRKLMKDFDGYLKTLRTPAI